MHRTILATVIAAVFGTGSLAQDYPSQAVTLVVPYGAGGASDLAGRALAEVGGEHLGQPIVVTNQPGAGGMVGARTVSNADPDGYTLLLSRVGMALSPAVTPADAVPHDAYTFLGILEATPMILAVQAASPYESVEALLEAIEQEPGALTYAASGATSIDGFTVQALLSDVDLDPLRAATLIPYQGGAELATALLGGHVDFLAIAAASLMPHIESGDMRPLMIYSPSRMDQLPDVPTAQELGYERAGQVIGWSGLYGPPDLPEEIVSTWSEVLAEVAEDDRWHSLAGRRGSVSTIGTYDPATFIEEQYQFFRELAAEFGYLD
ncbi:tripartite tricarboxylate transporter substrate binding protein [Pararhodobacter sp. SW119]|uniref:Bug family tripartite tricarboxylate transporter substrate binding protein n=1 Tax=Pararhodobacter sp. SW119 TaxID=2780075 RepID=UPI001AE08308|nr:tripartite tricarboxylate transporter substrate binding protein [Pararhodobacter sp. SW119]